MATNEEKLEAAKRRMLDRHLRQRGICNGAVLDAFARTPRESFVPPESIGQAYADYPVSIGYGQTISQPYIVALMLQELDPLPSHRVLDVGAGSGYQTALLARLAGRVYAVERFAELADGARDVLAELGAANVTLAVRDGSVGWCEHAPFDRIISGAAAPDLPAPWVEQLAEGGRIVVPLGGKFSQTLAVYDKHRGELSCRKICGVRFVQLVGRYGW